MVEQVKMVKPGAVRSPTRTRAKDVRDPTSANVGLRATLNEDKTEIDIMATIGFLATRKRAPPLPRPDVERISRLPVLGVIMNDKLTAADHVTFCS